jgi:hypothetical protein
MFLERILVEEFFEHLLVEGGAGDFVFLGGPIAEIEQAAAIAAKRELGVAFVIGGFVTNGTLVFHRWNLLLVLGHVAPAFRRASSRI